MTSIDFHNAHRRARSQLTNTMAQSAIAAAKRAVGAIATWNKRRRDRAAFVKLLGKDDWVFRDIGITRSDVEWASRLPMHVNAAKEVERLRAKNMQGR